MEYYVESESVLLLKNLSLNKIGPFHEVTKSTNLKKLRAQICASDFSPDTTFMSMAAGWSGQVV